MMGEEPPLLPSKAVGKLDPLPPNSSRIPLTLYHRDPEHLILSAGN